MIIFWFITFLLGILSIYIFDQILIQRYDGRFGGIARWAAILIFAASCLPIIGVIIFMTSIICCVEEGVIPFSTDGQIYRWLGSPLIRRGDDKREKEEEQS